MLKLLACRPEDREDIQALLIANAGELDLEFVREHWGRLADCNDP